LWAYRFTNSLQLFSVPQRLDEITLSTTKTTEKPELLSFNLSLTNQQKQQRENVVLPHLEAQKETPIIHYTPDDGDDFDEEVFIF
jgi:hypothetical protein